MNVAEMHVTKLTMSLNCGNNFQPLWGYELLKGFQVIRYVKVLYHSETSRTYQFLVSSLEVKTCLFIQSKAQH